MNFIDSLAFIIYIKEAELTSPKKTLTGQMLRPLKTLI